MTGGWVVEAEQYGGTTQRIRRVVDDGFADVARSIGELERQLDRLVDAVEAVESAAPPERPRS